MPGLLSFLQGIVNIFFSAWFRVEGDSMLPSLSDGQSVLVVRTRFRWNRLRRGDVVVFERPGGKERRTRPTATSRHGCYSLVALRESRSTTTSRRFSASKGLTR